MLANLAEGTAEHASVPDPGRHRALATWLRADHPRVFWLSGATAYLLAVVVSLVLTPPDSPHPLVDPAPGVAALWFSGVLRRPGLRRPWPEWAAAASVVLAPVLAQAWVAKGPATGLLHGTATLSSALVMVAASRRLLESRRISGSAALWRYPVCGAAAAAASMPWVLVFSGTAAAPSTAGAWLAWGMAAVAGTVVPVLLGRALLADRGTALRPAPARTVFPLVAAALVAGSLDIVADQRLYLLIPLLVWAASTLTVPGTAAYTLLVLGLALRGATSAAGPFAIGNIADRTLTVNTVAIVLAGTAMALAEARAERAALVAQLTARTREVMQEASLFATVLAATQDAVVTLDAGRRVVLANDAAHSLAAACHTSVEGLLAASAYDGPDPLALALDSGRSAVADVRLRPAGEGGPRIVALRAYPMHHEGRPGAVVFLQDVTVERRRTEGLQYFARTLAHDLRNPLTGIRLSSELAASALGQGDTDEAVAMMAAITASGDRATELLRAVSDFSLADDGVLTTRSLYLDDFVDGIVRERAAEVGAMPLEVTVDADVCVQADPRLLARVIENLLGNAAKYAVPGTLPTVEVRAWENSDGRATVVVQDRGIGIPPGHEQRIFDAFHRVPQHAESHAGTGLGLAICRLAIERHGGTISAEPRVAGGTVFRFSLPLSAELPAPVLAG